jgi:NADH:ubiquinone oxidoreductase subunit 3 (subunit A)
VDKSLILRPDQILATHRSNKFHFLQSPIPCIIVPRFDAARRIQMQYALVAIWCLIFITGIVAYIPLMYIRKTDKLLKILQQIEANTRKQ